MAWRKMATAPKDGSRFLAKDACGNVDIFWWQSRNQYGYQGFAKAMGWFSYSFHEGLTAWVPLPSA